MFPKWSDWDLHYTGKGTMKKKARQAFRICALVAAVVGVYRLRKDGQGLGNLPSLFRQVIRSSLLTAIDRGIAVNSWLRQEVVRRM